MLTCAPLLLALLLRDDLRGDPAALRAQVDQLAPAPERPLLLAAIALRAGEPGRARRELPEPSADDDVDAVAAALRRLAAKMERGWFPGAGSGPMDPAPAPDELTALADPDGADARLLVLLVRDLLAPAFDLRSFATDLGRGFEVPGVRDLVEADLRTAVQAAATSHQGTAVAAARRLEADLTARAGDFDRTDALLERLLRQEARLGDACSVAADHLLAADRLATPGSHPELLGLALGANPPRARPAPRPEAALGHLDLAERTFTEARAPSGLAAVALRRAALAADADGTVALRLLDQARRLADDAGDTGLVQVADTHRALTSARVGRRIDDGAAAAIVQWATTDGSRSLARGLAHLAAVQAGVWSDAGRFVPARDALRFATDLAAGLEIVDDVEQFGRSLADLYARASHPGAAIVLNQLELAEAAVGPLELATWSGLVERAAASLRDAVGLADPDLVEQSAAQLSQLLDQPADVPDVFRDQLRAVVSSGLQEATVLAPLYRGRRARLAGRTEEAATWFDRSWAAVPADAGGDLMRLIVLSTTRRLAEAREVLARLDGALAPELVASIAVAIDDPGRARAALAALEEAGEPTTEWDRLAVQAEAARKLGDPHRAVEVGSRAMDRFEDRLAALSRDVLRSAATDVSDVAAMYLDLVLAHLDLATQDGVEHHVADAFVASDRGRSLAFGAALGADGVDPSTRAWLRAGAEWASAYEQTVAVVRQPPERRPPAVDLRRHLAEVERGLDTAESALERARPGFLATRRRPAPPVDPAALAAALPDGTLLVQYHAFDDDLVVWTLTRDRLDVHRQHHRWDDLTGTIRRFHEACAVPGRPPSERDGPGRDLGGLLLDPIAAQLDVHPRVVIVPYGGQFVLPFHLLPFAGDVLGSTHAVSLVPAASLVPHLARRVVATGRTAPVVVGDPAFAPDRALAALPGAAVEALAVARLLGTTALIGPFATEPAVRSALAGAPVVHLATHGRVLDDAPNSGEVALAGDDSLTVADLLGIDIAARLVTMSACDTGRGRATLGGDVVGLTRALLLAGARNIVVSLWPVDDQTAALIMTRFYERLVGGTDIAASLALAQQDLRRLTPDERQAAFRALGERVGVDPAAATPATSRGWHSAGAEPLADPDHPHPWGPFVHIGI